MLHREASLGGQANSWRKASRLETSSIPAGLGTVALLDMVR